jgi:class 3 adenylate cyclase
MTQHAQPMKWVWTRYLPEGSLALLSAYMKVGKSTFVYALALQVSRGKSFLGYPTSGGAVLILAVEEHPRDVRRRLVRFGMQTLDAIHIHAGVLLPEQGQRVGRESRVSRRGVRRLAAQASLACSAPTASMRTLPSPTSGTRLGLHIQRYAEEVRRTHGIGGLAIRVGLNSGEVVVRALGSDLRMDYTAVGQTTHLAARMDQLAKPDTTLLTADTLRLAEGFIAVTPLGPVPVKGLDAPIEVYELTGAGPASVPPARGALRELTRFVGRDGELEQLRQALGLAAGRPRPKRACWTCDREVAPMRFRAVDLRAHGWEAGRRCSCMTGAGARRSTSRCPRGMAA